MICRSWDARRVSLSANCSRDQAHTAILKLGAIHLECYGFADKRKRTNYRKPDGSRSRRMFKVCRVLWSISESSGPYNQFTYPFAQNQDITLVVMQTPNINIRDGIKIIRCDNNIRKFLIAIIKAIRESKFDLFHIHHANLAPLVIPAVIFRSNSRMKRVFTLGTCFYNLKLRHKAMIYIFINFYNSFVCCSSAVEESIPSTLRRLSGKRLRTIRHGINLERIAYMESECERSSTAIVATRLIASKNVDQLLAAMGKASSDLRMIVAGDGSAKRDLERLSATLGLEDRVSFIGLVGRDEVLAQMCRSRIYISASKSDGMPIAVLEAIVSGCLPVLSDSGPHRELKDLGITAFYFPQNDTEALAASLDSAMALSEAERCLIIARNREIALDRFSVVAMMAQYEALAMHGAP